MEREAYQQIVERSLEKQVQERSIAYLAEHLGRFLKKRERVIICFAEYKEGNLTWLMEQAALRCGAAPVVWGPDYRWKTLLRLAFSTKASAIIGAPLIVLGLTKLAKAYATPLYICKVITAAYPCMDWMIDGIAKGFDSVAGGCFTLGLSGVVAGFACGHSWGVHLWDSEYGVDIVDEHGELLPAGSMGEIVLYPKDRPSLRYPTGEFARLETALCACGCTAPRLLDINPGKTAEPDLMELGQLLQSWTSILDCRLDKGSCGLEIELVTFPGEKLPKLPSAARLVIRPFDPEREKPFRYVPRAKDCENPMGSRKNAGEDTWL